MLVLEGSGAGKTVEHLTKVAEMKHWDKNDFF
jgi:hypothetical protein